MAQARKRFFSEDEKTVAEIRDRFLKVNNGRIRTVRNALKQRQQIFLDILPLLLHYNEVQLPGYVSDRCPTGIYDYVPDTVAADAARKLIKHYSDKRMPLREYHIYALYLIGSTGTIAYTDRSDLDIWVCHRSDMADEDIQLLKQKCRLLSDWAATLDLEANFFVLTPESIRDGQIETMSYESSGSAQHLLLIEEFYRSGLLLAGRIPAWWLVPPEHENNYYQHLETLLAKKIITENDIIDFGDVNTIPATEFYGAALWQLNKAINSPYKSMLKLLLMEAYASEYPKTELLCTHLKRAIYEGETNIDKLDSYVLMIGKLDDYLSTQESKERIDLARKCFYFKVHEWLTGNNSQEKSRTYEIMSELTTRWNWTHDQLLLLDSRETWKIDRVLEERSILVDELTNSYRMMTDLVRQHTAETSISQEDLNILGRRLYSAFERKTGKIDLINPGISVNLSEKRLVFVYMPVNDTPTWLLYRNDYDPANNQKQQTPIKRSHHLIELVAWCHFNGILGRDTMVTLQSQLKGYTSRELLQLIDSFRTHFPEGKIGKSTMQQLSEPACIVNAALFINLGRDPLSSHTRKGLHLTSNRSDPLSFGGKWQNLVETCSCILVTSWGEILTQQYDGEYALLECITDQLAWAPVSHKKIPHLLRTYSFVPSYGESISKRTDRLFEDLVTFFYRNNESSNARYLLRVQRYHALIQVENDVPRYEILHDNRELMQTLGSTQDQYCAYYFDRYANDDMILKLLQRYNKPGIIQLYYLDREQQADIYVLDEHGSLYTQQIDYYDIPTMLGHYKHFFDAALKRHSMQVSAGLGAEMQLQYDFCPIKKTVNNGYYIEQKEKPRISTRHNYFDIQVIGDINNIKNDSFYLYCDGKEFSNLEFGNNVLQEAVSYILGKRKQSERYPIYITDIDYNNSQPQNSKRIQTVQLLNQKKIIENKLNQTLKNL
jgi:adenylate cyclase class 1